MKVGDLVCVKLKKVTPRQLKTGLGLIVEIPYGVPNCLKVFWLESKRFTPIMRSNVEVVSEL